VFRIPVHHGLRQHVFARCREAAMASVTARRILTATGFAAVLAGSAGIAAAGVRAADSAEGADSGITGDALERASAAALAEAGGGRVTATEVGDDDSYYEVEVTRDDGSHIDVQLNESFAVVDSSGDVEHAEEGTG
jgi:hypothetical protein